MQLATGNSQKQTANNKPECRDVCGTSDGSPVVESAAADGTLGREADEHPHLCRRPVRSVSGAPRKNAFIFVAPRVALREACGSVVGNLFFAYSAFPLVTLGYPHPCRTRRGTLSMLRAIPPK